MPKLKVVPAASPLVARVYALYGNSEEMYREYASVVAWAADPKIADKGFAATPVLSRDRASHSIIVLEMKVGEKTIFYIHPDGEVEYEDEKEMEEMVEELLVAASDDRKKAEANRKQKEEEAKIRMKEQDENFQARLQELKAGEKCMTWDELKYALQEFTNVGANYNVIVYLKSGETLHGEAVGTKGPLFHLHPRDDYHRTGFLTKVVMIVPAEIAALRRVPREE